MTKDKFLAISATYARAALASVAALFLAGEDDLKVLVYAFAAGFLGPILKAVDPKASEFGVGEKKKRTTKKK
jgi:hypothetical protein